MKTLLSWPATKEITPALPHPPRPPVCHQDQIRPRCQKTFHSPFPGHSLLACQLALGHPAYASLEGVFRGGLYQNDRVFLRRLLPTVLPIDLHMLAVLFGSASTDWKIQNLVLVLSTKGFGFRMTSEHLLSFDRVWRDEK